LGYVGIGKPNALGGNSFLYLLLNKRNVIVFGENDDGDGRRGMESSFQKLKGRATPLRKCLPPAQAKDIRKWHPPIDEFEIWIKEHATAADPSKILETDRPLFLMNKFLTEEYTLGEYRLLHYIHKDFFKWAGGLYERSEEEALGQKSQRYFSTFELKSNKKEPAKSLKIDSRFVTDLLRLLKQECFVKVPDGIYEPRSLVTNKLINSEKIIVFRNGLYDIEAGTLTPYSPTTFITSSLAANYQPGADYPKWRGYVNDWFNGDKKSHDLLQEWYAYCMIASNRFEKMMIFYGGRNAGKSTVVSVLEHLLGPARCAVFSLSDTSTQFGLQNLVGKYIATIGEETASKREATKVLTRLKQITGRDTSKVNRKYRDSLDLKLFCRFIWSVNKLSVFDDESLATIRRLNILYFPNCYEDNPNHDLKKELEAETDGIAMWALED